MGDETARIEITATSSRLAAALDDAFKKITDFSGKSEKKLSGIGKFMKKSGLGDAGKHALGYIGGNMVMRGVDAFHEGAEHVLEFEQALSRLQISSMQTPAQIDNMRRAARQLGRDVALDPSVVVEGAQAFVDLAGASAYSAETMGVIARTAKATNSPIQDIVTMVYTLKDALHIDPKDFENVMSGLHEQSKEGSVHFNKMAGEFIALAPKFARFGVAGREGALQLGAMFQIIRSGVKSPEEVTTGLDGIFRGLRQHADKFKKAGVRVFDMDPKTGMKTLRPFQDIMHDIEHSALYKDPQKLIKAFGRGEGESAFRILVEHAKQYVRLMEMGADTESVSHDLMQYLASDAGRIEKSMNDAKIATQEAFTPERIKKFADIAEKLADKMGTIADKAGLIADVLGGLEGVGEKVRGFIDPDGTNPFVEDWSNARNALSNASAVHDDAGVKRQMAAMDRAVENSHAYQSAVKGIMGGERDGLTTKDSIRWAVLLSHTDPGSKGGLGFWDAGTKYLSNAKVSPEEQAKIYAEAQKEVMAPFLELLTKALPGLAEKPTEVKVDSEVVAKANKKSVAPRRRH